MRKTIILALFTLLLAVATLVTNVVSAYTGGANSAASATPAQFQAPQPVRAPLRAPARVNTMQASIALEFRSL